MSFGEKFWKGVEGLANSNAGEILHSKHVAESLEPLAAFAVVLGYITRKDGEILRAAALLHDIARNGRDEFHDAKSAEMVLRSGLSGISSQNLRLLSRVILFHKRSYLEIKKESKGKEESRALRIASLLRIPDGLDNGRKQTCRIAGVYDSPSEIIIAVKSARKNAPDLQKAGEKADVFAALTGRRVRVLEDWEEEPRERETLNQLFSRIVRAELFAMASHERGVLDAADPEELHKFRVAGRRLRVALRHLEKQVEAPEINRALSGLRSLFSSVGRLRDLDVLKLHIEDYCSETGAGPSSFAKLLGRIDGGRKADLDALKKILNSPGYYKMKSLISSAALEGAKKRGQAAGRAGLKVLNRALKSARKRAGKAQRNNIASLHAMRIASKKLRYTGEFLSPFVGRRAKRIGNLARRIQTALGSVHDVDIANAEIERYLAFESLSSQERAAASELIDFFVRRREESLEEFERLKEKLMGNFKDFGAGLA